MKLYRGWTLAFLGGSRRTLAGVGGAWQPVGGGWLPLAEIGEHWLELAKIGEAAAAMGCGLILRHRELRRRSHERSRRLRRPFAQDEVTNKVLMLSLSKREVGPRSAHPFQLLLGFQPGGFGGGEFGGQFGLPLQQGAEFGVG